LFYDKINDDDDDDDVDVAALPCEVLEKFKFAV